MFLLRLLVYYFTTKLVSGWAEVVSGLTDGIGKWPRNELGNDGQLYTAIRYCFPSPTDRNLFQEDVKKARRLWEDLIGPPGPDTGHSLRFGEFSWQPGQWSYCYLYDGATWNPDVPTGTLVIRKTALRTPVTASLGHLPDSWRNDAARHTLDISPNLATLKPDEASRIAVIAHELAHVFGFQHEHQRPDRELYVHFQCEKLLGYEEVKARVEARGQHTMEQVCDDSNLADEYGMVSGYTSLPYKFDDGTRLRLTTSKYYDYHSITHYASIDGAHGVIRSPMDCPLFAWSVPNPNAGDPPKDGNTFLIPIPLVPSEGDRDGIKAVYGWSLS